MDVIKIFIVDDHRIFLEGLVKLIQEQSSMRIVGTAGDGRTALKHIETLRPDIVLMDISMPGLNGLEVIQPIRKASPSTKTLILSMHDNEAFLRKSIEAGAVGYLLKDSGADELFLAIKEAYRGHSYLSPSLTHKLIEEYRQIGQHKPGNVRASTLTSREREILQLLAEGSSNQAIANLLNISHKTVATHRKRIMEKLNLHSINALVRYAIRNRIIEP